MKEKLTEFGSPEKVAKVFSRWDTNGDGSIDKAEFTSAVTDLDLRGLRPKRISVERVVSGPGISDIYGFLRQHWAYSSYIDPKLDNEYVKAPAHMRGAIVAKGSKQGQTVCKKAIDIFNECYGSEVRAAAAPTRGLDGRLPSAVPGGEGGARCDAGRAAPSGAACYRLLAARRRWLLLAAGCCWPLAAGR